jgi:RNA polymerase sigma factor (sigma-70 family)
MLLGDAEEDAVNANLNECLTDSVKKLPENERNVINLHLEGKSFKAIGEELGICAQAAFKRYRKALKKLKNKLI